MISWLVIKATIECFYCEDYLLGALGIMMGGIALFTDFCLLPIEIIVAVIVAIIFLIKKVN